MKRCKQCKVPLEGAFSKILQKLLKVSASKKDPALCNRCSDKTKPETYLCQICNRVIDEEAALTHIKAEEYILHLIKKDHPEWKEDKETCPRCVNYYRELIKKAEI
jgi:hypothetical protein